VFNKFNGFLINFTFEFLTLQFDIAKIAPLFVASIANLFPSNFFPLIPKNIEFLLILLELIDAELKVFFLLIIS